MLKVDNVVKYKKTICSIFIALANISFGADIYTNSISGSDVSGDGSFLNPYQSFHQAYTTAQPGDTLNLTGTFDWSASNETGDAGVTGYTITKSLTIRGDGANSTYIQAASSPSTAGRCVFTINHDVTFEAVTIRYGYNTNQAENSGGVTVMDNVRDNVVIMRNCIIEDNAINNGVTSNYNFAGGIYLRGNTSFHPHLEMYECIVRNNSATGRAYGAGGLYSLQSNSILIESSTFYNNSGTDGGAFGVGYHNVAGGIAFFRFNDVKITNSTFSGNVAETSGGAMRFWYCQVHLTNNTIAYNEVTSPSGKGGGVYFVFMQQSPGMVYLKNNLIANNSVGTSDEDVNFNTDSWSANIMDNGHNIIEYYTGSSIVPSGTGTITGNQTSLNIDPILGLNNANNGVLTHALLSGSVAENAGGIGSNNLVTVPDVDQRGLLRNAATDIGAYEVRGIGLPVELKEFYGQYLGEGSVLLTWTTLFEINNERFELSHSTDGVSWVTIDEQQGAGNSQQEIVYSYEARDVRSGVNYFRLKQFDFDGKSEEVGVVAVEVDIDLNGLLYPNPAQSFFSVNNSKGESYIIRDYQGKIVDTGFLEIGSLIYIDVLPDGIYFIHLNRYKEPKMFIKASN